MPAFTQLAVAIFLRITHILFYQFSTNLTNSLPLVSTINVVRAICIYPSEQYFIKNVHMDFFMFIQWLTVQLYQYKLLSSLHTVTKIANDRTTITLPRYASCAVFNDTLVCTVQNSIMRITSKKTCYNYMKHNMTLFKAVTLYATKLWKNQ